MTHLIDAQLARLAKLRGGWLDGDGFAPDAEALNSLAMILAMMPPAHLYPTPAGGVFAEWQFGPQSISVEFRLPQQRAELHILSRDTDETYEETFSLSDLTAARHVGHLLFHIGCVYAASASTETHRKASKLLCLFPARGELETAFSVDTDGGIAITWFSGPNRVFSVSISNAVKIAYAWGDGENSGHGVEMLDDVISALSAFIGTNHD